jgi:putative tryptophan/tyrosine transport system substrate-binding protein
MKRREFITLLGSAAASWPLAARAQQAVKLRRVGILARTSAASLSPLLDSFRQGLRDLGWAEGNNISIEYQLPRRPGKYGGGRWLRWVRDGIIG